MDGLGLELRIFNLTHQKRWEAKVDLKYHFKNMSKWLQIAHLWMVWGSDWIFSILTPNYSNYSNSNYSQFQPQTIQMCNLKSFWQVFEVTSKVNFVGSDWICSTQNHSQMYNLKFWSRHVFVYDLFWWVKLNNINVDMFVFWTSFGGSN